MLCGSLQPETKHEYTQSEYFMGLGDDPVTEEYFRARLGPEKPVDKVSVAREAILQELRRRWKNGPIPEHGVTAPSDISRFHKPQTNYFCGAGVMECPVCRAGKLKYHRSVFNGHVHARCSTDGCVAWDE